MVFVLSINDTISGHNNDNDTLVVAFIDLYKPDNADRNDHHSFHRDDTHNHINVPIWPGDMSWALYLDAKLCQHSICDGGTSSM